MQSPDPLVPTRDPKVSKLIRVASNVATLSVIAAVLANIQAVLAWLVAGDKGLRFWLNLLSDFLGSTAWSSLIALCDSLSQPLYGAAVLVTAGLVVFHRYTLVSSAAIKARISIFYFGIALTAVFLFANVLGAYASGSRTVGLVVLAVCVAFLLYAVISITKKWRNEDYVETRRERLFAEFLGLAMGALALYWLCPRITGGGTAFEESRVAAYDTARLFLDLAWVIQAGILGYLWVEVFDSIPTFETEKNESELEISSEDLVSAIDTQN